MQIYLGEILIGFLFRSERAPFSARSPIFLPDFIFDKHSQVLDYFIIVQSKGGNKNILHCDKLKF